MKTNRARKIKFEQNDVRSMEHWVGVVRKSAGQPIFVKYKITETKYPHELRHSVRN